MKQEAKKRMRRVNKDYKKNEKKFKAEGKRLCYLQHEEYINFYDVFIKNTKDNERHHKVALFKETIKVKHITLTPINSTSCMNLLLSYIAFSHNP